MRSKATFNNRILINNEKAYGYQASNFGRFALLEYNLMFGSNGPCDEPVP